VTLVTTAVPSPAVRADVRVAILILAHQDIDQLNALVEHLAADFSVYVHLDRKSSLHKRDVVAGDRIHVIRRRRVYWGSYGMILATRDLMRLAMASHCDRYILISGQDIPLQSNADIAEFFNAHREEEFIECDALPRPGAVENGWLDRVTRFYLPSARGVGGVRGRVHKEAFWRFYRANTRLGISRATNGITFYGGANWWNLTHEAVSGIVDYLDREPSFLHRFRMTSCADEIIFQTALVAVGLQSRVVPSPLRFVDWSEGGAHPRTLRAADYPWIRESGMLFARKVDPFVDPDLVRLLWSDVRGPHEGEPAS
jgi:hypothetical protein